MVHSRKSALAAVLLVGCWTGLVLSAPLLVRYAIDQGVSRQRPDAIDRAALALVAVAALAYIAYWTVMLLLSQVMERFLLDLRVVVFEQLQSLPLSFFEQQRSGALVAHITADVDAISRLSQEGLFRLLNASMALVVALGILFTMSPALAGLLMLMLAPVAFLGRAFHIRAQRTYGAVQQRTSDLLGGVREAITGIRLIQ